MCEMSSGSIYSIFHHSHWLIWLHECWWMSANIKLGIRKHVTRDVKKCWLMLFLFCKNLKLSCVFVSSIISIIITLLLFNFEIKFWESTKLKWTFKTLEIRSKIVYNFDRLCWQAQFIVSRRASRLIGAYLGL